MQTPEEITMLAIKAKNDPTALLHLWQGCSRYAYKVTIPVHTKNHARI